MVNFKLGEENRNVFINMSRARDKQELMTFHTPVECSNHCVGKDSWRARPHTISQPTLFF